MCGDEGNGINVLNTEESVVLGNTLAARRSTSLDLAGAEGNDEVGDDGGDPGGRWMSAAIEGGREVREREARVEKGKRTPL